MSYEDDDDLSQASALPVDENGRPVQGDDESRGDYIRRVNAWDKAEDDRLAPYSAKSITSRPKTPTPWLVQGLLRAGAVFLLWGAKKTGKTFLAMDLGLCIATGRDWHGRPTRQGQVIHVIGEGNESLMWDRVTAWIEENGEDEADKAKLTEAIAENWSMLARPVLFDRAAPLKTFLDANLYVSKYTTPDELPALVIIDPVLRHMAGDVSNTAHASAFIAGVDAIRLRSSRTAVLIVHHEGKKAEAGPLGSIVFGAAIDGEARLTEDNGRRKFEVTDMRDADPETIAPLTFLLAEHYVREGGEDDFGDVYSAALQLVAAPAARLGLSAPDRLLLAIADATDPDGPTLAKALGVQKPAITKSAASLRSAGLLDGWKLTKDGQARLAELRS